MLKSDCPISLEANTQPCSHPQGEYNTLGHQHLTLSWKGKTNPSNRSVSVEFQQIYILTGIEITLVTAGTSRPVESS